MSSPTHGKDGRFAFRFLVAAVTVAALATPIRSFAQAPTFNAEVTTYTNSSYNRAAFAAVGDFNRDGKLDALVADGSASIRLMLGNGNGTFSEHDVSVPNTNPGTIKVGDLNGDGLLDAVFVSNGAQAPYGVTVLLNTGNDGNGVPQFSVTNYSAGMVGVRSVAIGDLNGDGHPDLVVGNCCASVAVLLNAGDGTFVVKQGTSLSPSNGGPSVGQSAIVDVNGDGKADYIVTSNQSGATNVFFGNGDGTLQPPVVIPSMGLALSVVDVNHDGKPDLVEADPGSAAASSGKLMVFLNNGDGKFSAPPALYPSGVVQPLFLTTSDLDGDGNVDVVIADFGGTGGGHQVGLLRGDGTGAFGAATLYQVNRGPRDVAVDDFNGDGELDIATVGYSDNTYGVLLNNSRPPDTTAPVVTVVPGDQLLEATGPSGAVAAFSATATDPDDAAGPVTCTRSSGSTFGFGTTTVVCSSTDTNHNTGTDSFNIIVRDTTPPALLLPPSQTVEATGPSGAAVSYTDSAYDIVSGSVPVSCSSASGSTFPLGTTLVSCSATDGAGNTSNGAFNVTVQDTTPPAITAVTPSQASLWPPNKKMTAISVAVAATDAVTPSPACQITSVTSNEPGAGEWSITGALTLQLQADRLGTGSGRIYTIAVTCTDKAGNASSRSTTVSVPHDQGK